MYEAGRKAVGVHMLCFGCGLDCRQMVGGGARVAQKLEYPGPEEFMAVEIHRPFYALCAVRVKGEIVKVLLRSMQKIPKGHVSGSFRGPRRTRLASRAGHVASRPTAPDGGTERHHSVSQDAELQKLALRIRGDMLDCYLSIPRSPKSPQHFHWSSVPSYTAQYLWI